MQDSTRSRLSLYFTALSIVILILIGYLGYDINKKLEHIRRETEKIFIFNNIKQFWEEISLLSQKSAERSLELKQAMLDASAGLANLIHAYQERKDTINKQDIWSDQIVKLYFSDFMRANTLAHHLIEKTLIEYDEIRLKYSSLAHKLNIQGWNKFFYMDKEMSEWALKKYKLLRADREFVYDLKRKGNIQITIDLHKREYMTEDKALGIEPPYRNQLSSMMSLNIKKLGKKPVVNKNEVQ